MMYKCNLCQDLRKFPNQNSFVAHLRSHKIKPREYYARFINKNSGHCKICGKDTEFLGIEKGFRCYCSRECIAKDSKNVYKDADRKRRETLFKKTGYENAMQNPEIAKISYRRSKDALNKKYGVDNPNYIDGVKEKQSNNNAMKRPEIREKLKESFIKSIGVDNPFKSKDIMKKVEEERELRTGYKNPMQNPDIKNKAIKTLEANLNMKLGEFLHKEEFNKKRSETMIKKFGKEHPIIKPKYELEGLPFDSLWEVYYYAYCKIDLKLDIIRNQNDFLLYALDNKTYKFYPDFKIGNKFIEVKGLHLINDGKWINIIDPSLNPKFEAKQKCAIENKVLIITHSYKKKLSKSALCYITNNLRKVK